MSESAQAKQPILFLLGCFFAGALFSIGAALVERGIHRLSAEPGHLLVLFGLGGLAGTLLGLANIRLRRLKRELEDSRGRLQQFYQKTPAILHSMDSEGRLLYVSQSWLDTLGYTLQEVIGRDFFDLVVGESLSGLRTEYLARLRDLGEIKDLNCTLQKASGATIEVSLSAVAQHDLTGKPTENLVVLKDLTIHRAAEERIERLAYYDTLTGLPNRTLMNDRMLQSIAQAKRENCQLGVFYFDLDRFKLINDTQGHAVGDLVLRSVAHRLKKFIREGDTFARLGGDEFVILLADPNHDPNFTTMGNRILEALGRPFSIGSREFFTTASIGVAIYPTDGEDPQTLLKSADTAMYVAKSRGRNNIQFFSDDMHATAIARTSLESRLRQALNKGELQLHYQPQVNLLTGRITGVEALLRWYDGKGNLVPPGQIIKVAEECGLIFPLGEWVLQTACAQAKKWQEENLSGFRMSVNLSGHHIRQANFIDRIEEILSSTGISPNTLEIELAENSVMGQVNDSIMALTDLKVRGISLAIDDFGTGYSSLLYLKHFPIHRIKIAQEFIRDIIHNPDYAAITEAILGMAKSLNLSVTAVGVEDPQQLSFLRERGCLEVQGKLFGLAMDAEEMTAFLRDAGDLFRELKESGPNKRSNVEGSKELH